MISMKHKTKVMGILNATPDSFSDGGAYNQIDEAVRRAQEMEAEGADMIDIGGESTRPGAEEVSKDVEQARVLPVIEAVSAAVNVPVSIDTYKADTAERAVAAGASMINDVWGARREPAIADVAFRYQVPLIVMHNQSEAVYENNIVASVISGLRESIAICRERGVPSEHIILDPGIGFGKTYEHNLEIMRRLGEITALGYEVLLGTSRKSLIAKTLDLPVDERVEGTAATICLGIERGCGIVRVHDVQEMVRTARMMDAMLGTEEATTIG
ncbi:dihydropteroate synthase [Salsuginibacillus halophilus]|uniref:Dihydropteroate synthase n=1 Tax=Salsuginibacillus halophilus TaxID=517424 RepID=A0A2P8H7W2_9BACI|nr:dihydropteroate synthase [Salsuginibacillus halophilus]PSL42279.1 dihydropteroate synthase [Salsuginibacillus halophilus]